MHAYKSKGRVSMLTLVIVTTIPVTVSGEPVSIETEC